MWVCVGGYTYVSLQMPVAVRVAASVCLCLGGAVYVCDYVFTCMSSVWVCRVCDHTFEIECLMSLPVCVALCVCLAGGHIIRRGAGMVLSMQAGCAPSAQPTSPTRCQPCHLPIFS